VRWQFLAGALALGCGSGGGTDGGASNAPPPPAPVTQLVGEMHLHQFPDGAHAWAAFIDTPLPIHALRGDSVTEIDTAVTLIEGPCTLYVLPTCAPGCASSAYCEAPNQCAPLPSWKYVDGGLIQVTGSTTVPLIRLWFDASAGAYLANPAPGVGTLFAGGEQLSIVGGAGDTAFAGELPAPTHVVVNAPDLTQLHLPVSGALDVTWVSEQTDEIEILTSATSNDGRSANIRCVTGDTGSLAIPADMIAALPPPPRFTRLEIVRVEQRIVPLAKAGTGIFVHAAQSTWANGRD
jgi:hypothetical protein